MMHKKVVKHVGRKRPSSAGYEKKKKMTNDEFIKAVNVIDNCDGIKAYKNTHGGVFLRTDYGDRDVDMVIAILGKHDTSWGIRSISQVMLPTKILELMAELADTPPAKRKGTPKYVILNGMPRYGTCYYFSVDCDEGQLITGCVIGSDIEGFASFSEERLCEAKKALTPELASAVDMMTVTLERAIELTEKSKHTILIKGERT